MKKIKPNPPTEVNHIDGWTVLEEELQQNWRNDDLLILLSARKGTIAWHPNLEELPKQLSESFIIYYPRERTKVDVRGAKGLEVPKEILRKKDYDPN